MIELTNADRIAIKRAETEQCSGEFLSDGINGYERAYRAGLAAGIERAAKHMESESTNTAIKIRALLK